MARRTKSTGTSTASRRSQPASNLAAEPEVDPRISRHIELRQLDDLTPYPRNARTHSRRQIDQIAKSIERFGFTNPVLIDDHDMILAGHGRVEAAKKLGQAFAPCIRLSSLSEAEKRAYVLADNKIAANAGWDEDILIDELNLIVQDETIDLETTGFSIAEVDHLLEPGGTTDAVDADEDDALPGLSPLTITQPGDLWSLGRHRLICGDAREVAVYKTLLATEGGIEAAHMAFTDPPYNVPIKGHVSGLGRTQHRDFAMASGEMTPAAFKRFLETVFDHMASCSRDGAIHFIAMDWRHMAEMLAAGKAVYQDLKNLIVWVKDNGGMGTFYRSRHELIFAWKVGTGPHINSFELGQHGRHRTNVWNYRGATSPTREARDGLKIHPTVKPVAMVADAMRDCSPRGGIILDPFCGSGTILIAAEKTGRMARAIEIDPTYCDQAIRRWEAWAHDDAILAATGETFDQVARRRRAEDGALTAGGARE